MVLLNDLRLSIVLSTHQDRFEVVDFKCDLESNITKIAGWSYVGVEFAFGYLDLVNVYTLGRVLAEYGLKVHTTGIGQALGEERLSFTNPDAKVRDAAVYRIKRHIQLAQRFNAQVIIGLIRGVTPPGQTQVQSQRFLIQCLQDCLDDACAQDVNQALEPLNRYETDLIHTAADRLEIIHQIGSPTFGLLLDTFHMNIEEAIIEESIRLWC